MSSTGCGVENVRNWTLEEFRTCSDICDQKTTHADAASVLNVQVLQLALNSCQGLWISGGTHCFRASLGCILRIDCAIEFHNLQGGLDGLR